MWSEDVDDSDFIGGELVYPKQAYIKELPTGWKFRCRTYEECKKGKTMDSAKKSVEKILEIAKKHGYACVVGFRQEGKNSKFYPTTDEIRDVWGGCTGLQKDVYKLMCDCLQPVWNHYKDGVKDGE